MSSEAMVEEFDTVASWTADAVAELDAAHALPAACRGSGSPAALDWLAERLGLVAGTRLLDVGAGVGGPAAYVAHEWGAAPVLVEPMDGACRAATRLFDQPVVVAEGARLPFADGSFDVVWSLGVLCTVEDKARHLGEMARVAGSGPVGLLVFVRTVEELPEKPEGNSFPSRVELDEHLGRSGLRVVDEAVADDLPSPPQRWQQAVNDVEAVIERDHGTEEGFLTAQRQSEQVGRLLSDGLLVGQLLVCRRIA